MGPHSLVAEVTRSAAPAVPAARRSLEHTPPTDAVAGATGAPSATGAGAATGGELRGAARHGLVNLLGVVVAALAGFALNIAVARFYTQSQAGLFFAATSAFVLAVGVSRLGSVTGTVYFVSRYRALGQPQHLRPMLIAGLAPVLSVGVALGTVGWLCAPWLARQIFDGPGVDGDHALRALAVFVPAAALADVAQSACQGFGRMRPLVLMDRLGRALGQLAAVAVVAWLGLSVGTALPLAWAAPYLPVAAVSVLWLLRLVHRAEKAIAPDASTVTVRSQLRPFWRYAGPSAAASLAQMTVQRLDILLLGALSGLPEAALYTAATRFLVIGQLAGQGVSAAVQHRIANHLARGDTAGAGGLYQAATCWLVLLAWPFYLLAAVFAVPMLSLFGAGYTEARSVTVVLALAMLVGTGCGMVDAVLNMAGRTTWTLYNALAALAANVGLNLLLIPRFGMRGAVVAWAAAIVIANLAPLAQLYMTLGLHPFGRGMMAAAGLSLACFGVPALVADLGFDASLPVLSVVAMSGVLVYLGVLWRLRSVMQLSGLLRGTRRHRRVNSGASVG